MEEKRYRSKVFINADCSKVMSQAHIEELNNSFEKYDFDGMQTFMTIIHNKPTFDIIRSSHRDPNNYGTQKNEDKFYDLSSFMSELEIKSLSVYQYLEDKIYGLVKQDDEVEDDLDFCEPKDLYLVTKNLIEYLAENELLSHHDETLLELNQLNTMANIAKNYNVEIAFFDDYFWG